MTTGVILGCTRSYLSGELAGHFEWFVECRLTGIRLDEDLTGGNFWPDVRSMLASIHRVDGAVIDREIDLAWGLWDDFRVADDSFWNLSFKLWRNNFYCGWAQVQDAHFDAVASRDITVPEHKQIIASAMAPFLEYAARHDAKKYAVKQRRSEFANARPDLLLAILDRGDPHMCAEPDCSETSNLTIDHIEPLSRGGTDDLGNLRLLCRGCNSRKGDRFPTKERAVA